MTYHQITNQNRLLYEKAERFTIEMKLFDKRSPEWAELFRCRKKIFEQVESNLEEVFRKLEHKRGSMRTSIGSSKVKNAKIIEQWKKSRYAPVLVIAQQVGCSPGVVGKAITRFLKKG